MVCVLLLACISAILFLPCQGQKIQQAKIFSESKDVPEGGKLEVTCSTFGFIARTVYVYLCKDGKAIEMRNGPSPQDTIFKIERIKKNNSGNYSCVFSEDRLEMTKVNGYGRNYIFINVIESLINTQIHLVKSEVPKGSDVEFICTTPNLVNKNQSKNMILVFLFKNEKPIKVNIWDTEKMKTTFTLREVRMEDAGTYSCAVLLNILPYNGMKLDPNKKVSLQITAFNISIIIAVTVCSAIVVLLSLFLGIWAVIRKQGCPGCHDERSEIELSQSPYYDEILKPDTAGAEILKPDTAGAGNVQSAVWGAAEKAEFSEHDSSPNAES